jgi:uncharacterized membrane protein YeaQ/YmgE (transglycosylase-associated protein family)
MWEVAVVGSWKRNAIWAAKGSSPHGFIGHAIVSVTGAFSAAGIYQLMGWEFLEPLLHMPLVAEGIAAIIGAVTGLLVVFLVRLAYSPLHFAFEDRGGLAVALRTKLGAQMWPMLLMLSGIFLFVVVFGAGAIWFVLSKDAPIPSVAIIGPVGPPGERGAPGPAGPPGPSATSDPELRAQLADVRNQFSGISERAKDIERLGLLSVCFQRLHSEIPLDQMDKLTEDARDQVLHPEKFPTATSLWPTFPLPRWTGLVQRAIQISSICFPTKKVEVFEEPTPVQMDTPVPGEFSEMNIDQVRKLRRFVYQSYRARTLLTQLDHDLSEEIRTASTVLAKKTVP